MAHCAEINQEGIVTRVIVVNDFYGDLTCEEWCQKTYGGTWKKTSYNTLGGVHKMGHIPLRKNYAGVGYVYDKVMDAFIPPRPSFKSWILNKETGRWEAPTAMPNDGEYRWDEDALNWIKQ